MNLIVHPNKITQLGALLHCYPSQEGGEASTVPVRNKNIVVQEEYVVGQSKPKPKTRDLTRDQLKVAREKGKARTAGPACYMDGS